MGFDAFDGNCDRTNVGAIDVFVPSIDGVDAIITQITGIGNPDPSPTPTPAPSASRSPAPAPSPSRTPAPSVTPTPSRTPSPQCTEVCNCPVFTCHLVFDFDDTDDQVFYN